MIAPDVVKSIGLGAYLVEWEAGGPPSVAVIFMDRKGVRWLAPSNWTSAGPLARHASNIKALRRLTRQGGISGAMYWGDEIR